MLPPKTEDEALDLIDYARGYYATQVSEFKVDEEYYEGDFGNTVEVPEGFEVTIPTTGRAIVDEAVDNVEPYEIFVRYAPRGFGKKPQEDADEIMRFLKNMWIYWRQSNSDIDVLRDFIKNLFIYGKGVFKCVPEQTLWPTLSSKDESELMAKGGKELVKEKSRIIKKLRAQNFPVIIRSMNPRHIMEDPTMDARKLWVIEYYEISNDEIRNRFAGEYKFFREIWPEDVQVYEVWTATWVDWNARVHRGKHWVFIQGEKIVEENNPYHDVPYVIKHSGFGTETYDGKPERKAVGFFTKQIRSLLDAEKRRITNIDALMQQFAFPIALLPISIEGQDFDLSPGAINYVDEDVMALSKNIFLQAQLPAPEYMQSLNMIQNQIERGTTQRAIRGAGVPGTDSAAQLSMITAQAKLRLEPIKRATEEAVDMINSLVLRYVDDVLEDSVSVFGAEPTGPDSYTLKPSQIKGRYRTRTSFMPNEEQVRERKLVLVTDAISKAGLNPYDAFTYAGWDNAMEVIQRNLAYKIMDHPSVQRQLAKMALEEWGLDATELEMAEMSDNTMMQQYQAMLQMQLAGQMQPGGDAMMEGQGQPQGGGGGGIPAAPPQAAGSPLEQVDQMPDVNQMRGMIQ